MDVGERNGEEERMEASERKVRDRMEECEREWTDSHHAMNEGDRQGGREGGREGDGDGDGA